MYKDYNVSGIVFLISQTSIIFFWLVKGLRVLVRGSGSFGFRVSGAFHLVWKTQAQSIGLEHVANAKADG